MNKATLWTLGLTAALAAAAAAGCAADESTPDALLLRVAIAPSTPSAVDTRALRFRMRDPMSGTRVPESSGASYETVSIPEGRDLRADPFVVRIRASRLTGAVDAHVEARSADGALLASFLGRLDIDSRAVVDITLAAPEPRCDADGDGVPDCTKAGCCPLGGVGDCDDSDPGVHPFRDEDACSECDNGVDEDCDEVDTPCIHSDSDGIPDCLDCDPDDPAVSPDSPEVCDGRDNDCDDLVDEGFEFLDADGAAIALGGGCGVGECRDGVVECASGGGAAICTTAGNVLPEQCGNRLDDDCDGRTDEDCEFADRDGDGVPDGADCPDYPDARHRAEMYPGAPEPCCAPAVASEEGALAVCDLDCDGAITACVDDADGDGVPAGIDCDDDDPTVHPAGPGGIPAAPERCGDGIDQDCVGGDLACDEGDDTDGDGYLAGRGDCDDTDGDVHPGAPERCNGDDDDCDGLVDEGNPETAATWGGAEHARSAPCHPGGEAIAGAGECRAGVLVCLHEREGQSSAAAVTCLDFHPAADEICDGRDDDCDGETDEDWPIGEACDGDDSDQCTLGSWTCTADGGAAECVNETTTDIDEVCDGDDNDCDGATDEGFEDLDGDDVADCVDPDDDGDGVADGDDLCPRVADPAQDDIDGDGDGDACDPPAVPTLRATAPASPANHNQPRVEGTAEPGAVVAIHVGADCDGEAAATGTAAGDGTFSIPLAAEDDATISIHAQATNRAGLTSPCTADPLRYVEDSTAPSPPAIARSVPAPPSNQVFSPVIHGEAEVGARVALYADEACTAAPAAEGAADGGAFAIPITLAPNAVTVLRGRATDAAGNTSACSEIAFVYEHDDLVPAAPNVERVSPPPPSPDDLTPEIVGTAEAHALVRLYVDASCTPPEVANGLAGSDGAFTLEAAVAPESTTRFWATATDAATNTSPCSPSSVVYTHDSSAPAVPVLDRTDPVSPSPQRAVTIHGTGEPESRVDLYGQADCSGAADVSGSVDATGAFALEVTAAANVENRWFARTTDEAGNRSACSEAVEYVHDDVAPAPATLEGTEPPSPSASVTAPEIIGAAEAFATIELHATPNCTDAPVGRGQVGDGGRFAVTASLLANTGSVLRARVTDAAGNRSPCPTDAIVYVHDDVPPAAPTLRDTVPSSPSNSNVEPDVLGSTEPRARVEVFTSATCEGAAAASGGADASGAFAIPTPVAAAATTALSARALDAAGNASSCGATSLQYTHDPEAPLAPDLRATTPPAPSNATTRPTVSGATEPGSVVRLYDTPGCSGAALASTGATDDGTFAIAVELAANTSTRLFATATDAAGNASPCSTGLTWTHDDVSPDAPVIQGTAPNSPSNAVTMPIVEGVAEPGAQLAVYAGAACDELLAEGRVGDDGAFALQVTVDANAATTLSARATDDAANPSTCGNSVVFVHDDVAPGRPALSESLPASPSRTRTDPTLLGTAEAGAMVRLYTDPSCTGTVAAEITADGNGGVEAPVTVVANTTTRFHATATDAAGNVSGCSAAFDYTHDDIPPDDPRLDRSEPASPSRSERSPTVEGTAEPGSTVRLYGVSNCTGAPAGEGAVSARGRFAVTVTVEPNSTASFYGQVTDAAGNVSVCSTSVVQYTHDDIPPFAPALERTSPTAPSAEVVSPQVIGTAEALASLRIYGSGDCSGEPVGEGSVDAAGSFSVRATLGANRASSLSADATDAAGNTSPCSSAELRYEHDDIAPEAPIVTGTDPTSPSPELQPQVMGTAEPGAAIAVHTDGCLGAAEAQGEADGSGAFSIRATADSNDTALFAAAAIDEAGNVSDCSVAVPYTHDSVPPATPTLTDTVPASPSSQSAAPLVRGTAEAGADVRLYVAAGCTGDLAASGIADGDGAFGVVVAVTRNTTTTFYATATDAAGNTSGCTPTGLAFTHDDGNPAPPQLASTTPASPSNASTAPVVQGSAEAGATVRIHTAADCTGAVAATTTAAGDGAFSVAVTVAANAATTLFATATDSAGNASDCSDGLTYVHDDIKPGAPVLTGSTPTSPDSSPTPIFAGTAEAGSRVRLYLQANCDGEAVASGDATGGGTFSLVAPVSDNASTTLHAQATDAAGNVSACSAQGLTYVHDDRAPAIPTNLQVTPTSPGSDATPTVAGNAEAGAAVRLYLTADCSGAQAAAGTATAGGVFSIDVAVATNADNELRARAIDAAGNASACSSEVSYRHDDRAPSAPTLSATAPASPSNVRAVRVDGSAEGHSTVELFAQAACGGAAVASGAAASGGSWSLQHTVAANTTTTFSARATDAAGNASPCSASGLDFTHDGVAPAAPAITGTAPSSPSRTVSAPRIQGTGEADATVSFHADAGCDTAELGNGSVDADGNFSVVVALPTNATTTVYAAQTDTAGNTSSCSTTSITWTHDSVPPDRPVVTGTTPASPSATDTSPTIDGTAEAGSAVSIYADAACGGSVVGSGTASGGAFAIEVTVVPNSTTTFTARSTDDAGNASACSNTAAAYTHDNTAPAPPVFTGTDPASPNADDSPEVLGSTDEGGATIRLYTTGACTGDPVATGTAAADGTFRIEAGVADDTTVTFRGTAADALGNTSACSTGADGQTTYVNLP